MKKEIVYYSDLNLDNLSEENIKHLELLCNLYVSKLIRSNQFSNFAIYGFSINNFNDFLDSILTDLNYVQDDISPKEWRKLRIYAENLLKIFYPYFVKKWEKLTGTNSEIVFIRNI